MHPKKCEEFILKKIFAATLMMVVFAMVFASCGNSKVNKAYATAVEWNKAEKKDPDSDKSAKLFKEYIASLSELNSEEREELVGKLKKAKLDKCARFAKFDFQKAKKILNSLEDATTEGANKVLDAIEKGIESFDSESFEKKIEEFGDSADDAIEDFASSLEATINGIDTEKIDSDLSNAFNETLGILDSLGSGLGNAASGDGDSQ